jgi:hypothetical protein
VKVKTGPYQGDEAETVEPVIMWSRRGDRVVPNPNRGGVACHPCKTDPHIIGDAAHDRNRFHGLM